MEYIAKIQEIANGFDIHTCKQVIKLRIDMEPSCCETTGFFMSEDDLYPFIDSALLKVTVTDTALKTHEVIDGVESDMVMFVTFETDRGAFQFVAYNIHNGYYGHTASIECEQLNESRCL